MSAAITTLAELAALNNTGATTEQQITEGKALFVLDSGSGFSGIFIYRQGSLPSNLLGVNSTGVPGGYWEAVGYKDLVEWVVSQNFTVVGHSHLSANLTDFNSAVNSLISSATIQYGKVEGRPPSIVNTINGESGNVTITAETLGAAVEGGFIDTNQILGFNTAVNSLINSSTTATIDWSNINNKPATATTHPSVAEVTGLQSGLDGKQPQNNNLTTIAFLGDNPPSSGFLTKKANQTWEIISLVTSNIQNFVADVNALITTAMVNLNNYPASLSAIAQLSGNGYLNYSGGIWSLSTPPGSSSEPGNYGEITRHEVGLTPVVLIPALAEARFVRITIDPSPVPKFIYFTDNSTNPTINNRSFLLPTGFMGVDGELGLGTLFAPGTEIRAFSPDGATYIYTQVASIAI